MPRLFGRPLSVYLPIFGFLYETEECPYDEQRTSKVIFQLCYTLFSAVALIWLTGRAEKTGSMNPFEQNRILQERKIEAQKNNERHDFLYQKIFGPYGYADTNFNRVIDSDEMLNAYKKVQWDEIPGSKPTLDDLEKLIKVYEKE